MTTEYSAAAQTIKPLDIIKVADYFCKIDHTKICQLRIIVRKIEFCTSHNQIISKPEEISQFIENRHLKNGTQAYESQYLTHAGSQEIPIKIEEGA